MHPLVTAICVAARPGVASIQPAGLSKAFVPEGLNEGSLAVYCLGCVQETNRPVGYGVIGSVGKFCQFFCVLSRLFVSIRGPFFYAPRDSSIRSAASDSPFVPAIAF